MAEPTYGDDGDDGVPHEFFDDAGDEPVYESLFMDMYGSDDSYDGLRVCETCGDRYCHAPDTICHVCREQDWIDKYG